MCTVKNTAKQHSTTHLFVPNNKKRNVRIFHLRKEAVPHGQIVRVKQHLDHSEIARSFSLGTLKLVISRIFASIWNKQKT